MSGDSRRICVTGGCGFLGRHLVRRLLQTEVERVVVVDNLSVGDQNCLPHDPRLEMIMGDVRDSSTMDKALRGIDSIFHFAAPTDVRRALADTRYDIDHGILGTHTVLESARNADVPRIVFASSSCVYGTGLRHPVAEDAGPLLPSSIYGAAKLAAEGLISAYCQTFSMQGWIFRFPNVVGGELTHGVVLDFINKLKKDSTCLEILGDGNQTKTYLWAQDCVEGVLFLTRAMNERLNVANITTRNSTSVREIAQLTAAGMNLDGVAFSYTGGARGWAGDVPSIVLDDSLARAHGWQAAYESSEAIALTIRSLLTSCNADASLL